MFLNRRQLLKFMSAGLTGSVLGNSIISQASTKSEIKAIAFDGFPIFDPRAIFKLTNTLYPTQGSNLAKLWFTKIFAYTWLRTVASEYKSFDSVIEDALLFSAESLKLKLSFENKQQLMNIWLNLNVWPDVKPALQYFKNQDIRLAFLSNFTEKMLRKNTKNSGIEDAFEFYLSTDRAQAYKPSPEAYQLAVDAFDLPKENIAFVAFASWDASGASWYGYPTVWVNRFNLPQENLDTKYTVTGKNLSSLIDFTQS